MPSIQSITLQNFKGIDTVSIDLEDKITCPVITLIGLNESGKTTILEGLSYFVSGDKAVSSLFDGTHPKSTINELIPVHRKAAFTGDISISAIIQLNESDYEKAQRIATNYKLQIQKDALLKKFTVTKRFTFEDSTYKNSADSWELNLNVSSKRSKTYQKYKRPEPGKSDLWLDIANQIEEDLPRIAYFPTFLVDMPDRIYLKEHHDEEPVNRYYRFVFQDILDSLGQNLALDKHVCARIENFKATQGTALWFAAFFAGSIKSQIDSVFQKISSAVTKEVLGSWRNVFQRAISAKNIFVEWNVDPQKADMPYASFVVSDGESRYAISERSLGFRWFFSFLLFTAFKQGQQRRTIFLFDEPAANLHAKAQAQLITSFSKLIADGNSIIYSTHSHHMINPRWLSGAYIVENTALDYESDDNFGLSTKPTNIQISKYRHFVAQCPTRSSYFQPVTEKLEYVTPAVIGQAPFAIVEGITDYFALTLVSTLNNRSADISLIPGAGAGASGPLISLLLGRGESFVILLDDDRAGKRAAAKYQREFFLDKAKVLTLADIDRRFAGMRLEGLISAKTHDLIKAYLECPDKPTKTQIALYLAEMCAVDKRQGCLSKETISNLTFVLAALAKRLQSSA